MKGIFLTTGLICLFAGMGTMENGSFEVGLLVAVLGVWLLVCATVRD